MRRTPRQSGVWTRKMISGTCGYCRHFTTPPRANKYTTKIAIETCWLLLCHLCQSTTYMPTAMKDAAKKIALPAMSHHGSANISKNTMPEPMLEHTARATALGKAAATKTRAAPVRVAVWRSASFPILSRLLYVPSKSMPCRFATCNLSMQRAVTPRRCHLGPKARTVRQHTPSTAFMISSAMAIERVAASGALLGVTPFTAVMMSPTHSARSESARKFHASAGELSTMPVMMRPQGSARNAMPNKPPSSGSSDTLKVFGPLARSTDAR
mmetsp:Transcript_118891/g.341512  ORF Transcript_118891/g.341512 Transcript_118891/m.341512 type:complete len:269 (-) Transcript_118891:199-1005(-)